MRRTVSYRLEHCCTATNCLIADNQSSVGYSGIYGATAQVTIIDSIVWGNAAQITGAPIVSYTDVQAGYAGTGNINADPCFVTGPDGDYYLSQIAAGQATNSPCVDAGSDTAVRVGMTFSTTRTDEALETGIVDMGYHRMGVGFPDIHKNLHVDFLDYAVLAADWLQCSSSSYFAGDIDRDECVDANDLGLLAEAWLDCYIRPAGNPNPADDAVGVVSYPVLSWTAGAGALQHDVYFGTNLAEVNDADMSSSACQGQQDSTVWDSNNFDLDGLDYSTAYYWRIDEIRPGCVTKGDVWNFTTCAQPDLNFGLVGWWELDETSGTIAYDSVGTNNGTLYGTPGWMPGQIDGALDCNTTDDYVRIPDNASLNPTQQITIAFWIYARTAGGGIYKYASCPDQTGKGSPGDSRAYILGMGGDGKAGLAIYSAVNTSDSLASTNAASLNQWQHIAATFNQGQAKIYINGQLDNTKAMSVSSIMNDAQPITFGGYWQYCGPAFVSTLNGLLDDVRIYNRALSDGEVQQLYQAGLP